MPLTGLLGDLPLSVFVERHYLKLPFARPGGCESIASLVDWNLVQSILDQTDVDVIIGRGHESKLGDRQPSFAEAREWFAQGYTIAIRHAERHSACLESLAQEFQEAFRALVDVQLYCTPAEQPGFGWHYDAEEVFVLQMQGSKEWSLRKNTVNPWPLIDAMPLDMRYEREIMPLMKCKLAANDWLYIPSGYWHSTQAQAESISLSVGIQAATALDIYDFVRQRLVESLQWRQRLPVGDGPDLEQHYRELFDSLSQDIAAVFRDSQTAQAFLQERNMRLRPVRSQHGGT